MFIYFSLKSVVISVQSSCIYDVWERWVSYRHLSSPAVTFVFNFYNENFLLSLSLSHTHTHRAGSGIDIFSPADTFGYYFYAKLFCSLCHTWIFTFIGPLCDPGDELMMINT